MMISNSVQKNKCHASPQSVEGLESLTDDLLYDIGQRSQNISSLLMTSKKISDLLASCLKKASVVLGVDEATNSPKPLTVLLKSTYALNPRKYTNIERLEITTDSEIKFFCPSKFPHYSNLRVLSLTDLIDPDLLYQLSHLKHLQELYLRFCIPWAISGWNQFLNASKDLEILNIAKVDFADDLILDDKALANCTSFHIEEGISIEKPLAAILRSAKNLQQLSIIDCRDLVGQALSNLSSSKLAKLNITQISANHRMCLKDFTHLLKLNPGLESLDLKHDQFVSESGHFLQKISFTPEVQSLNKLKFFKSALTETASVMCFLRLAQNLTHLYLVGTQAKNNHLSERLFLPHLERIETIKNNFHRCMLTDILRASPNLIELTIKEINVPAVDWYQLDLRKLRKLLIISPGHPQRYFAKHHVGVIINKAQHLDCLSIFVDLLKGSFGPLEGTLQNLEELGFQVKNLTDMEIGDLTRRSKGLKDARFSKIETLTDSALTRLATECPKLKNLVVSQCPRTTQEGYNAARRMLDSRSLQV